MYWVREKWNVFRPFVWVLLFQISRTEYQGGGSLLCARSVFNYDVLERFPFVNKYKATAEHTVEPTTPIEVWPKRVNSIPPIVGDMVLTKDWVAKDRPSANPVSSAATNVVRIELVTTVNNAPPNTKGATNTQRCTAL